MGTLLVSSASMYSANAAVDDTIAQHFPDANMAQAVADNIAGGDINTVLTQNLIDNVQYLYLNEKGIQDITGITIFSNLAGLNVYGNQITTIPDNISDLSNLNTLYLGGNQIVNLPNDISNLPSLQTLDLGNNQLTSLPENIANLSNLNNLRLDGNQFTELPESIYSLSNLVILTLNENQLAYLSDSIGNLVNLRTLEAGDNLLTSLPESIGNLASLNSLYLRSNQLTQLPESIGNLSNLSLLYLEFNQLTMLPESIGNLTNLYALPLTNNQLTSLPASFVNLVNLQPGWTPFSGNLLPTDYYNTINEFITGVGGYFNYQGQKQLKLSNDLSPYSITSEETLNNLNLRDMVYLEDGSTLFSGHQFILDNYVDELGNPADINDYIQNGKVIKEGKLFVQVRATGTGLFPNNSDHAITVDQIELDFMVEPDSVLPPAAPTPDDGDTVVPPVGEDHDGDLVADVDTNKTETQKQTSKTPQTGDKTQIIGLSLLLMASLGGLVAMKRKQKQQY